MSATDQTSEGEDDRLLVAEYALGLLGGAERETLERRLATEPALRADLALWRSRLAGLDSEIAEVTPRAATRGTIEARLFGTGARPASWWDSLMLWRGLAGAALAVAIGAVAIGPLAPRPDARTLAREFVAALSAEGGEASFVALYDPQAGMLRLTTLKGEPMPENDYELWAIMGEQPPMSLGVIAVGGPMDKKMPVMPEFAEGTVLAISVEPKGGSVSGSPTGPIVATGPAMPI
jgi:anti-sigma-K factor RskA